MPLVRSRQPMHHGRRLGGTLALLLAPTIAQARTPLPTLEVVQPKRPVRLLDVRWSAQVGGGIELGQRAPVLALGQVAHVSFVELGKAGQLHAAFGSSGFLDMSRGWTRRRGQLGVDLGVGFSRHVPGGPAFVATVTAGPRWARTASPGAADREAHALEAWRVDGWGVVGQLDAYPFYATIPELTGGELRWFRRYVLSGLHVWTAVRYDVLRTGSRTPALVGGGGFDLGRTLLLPILMCARAS